MIFRRNVLNAFVKKKKKEKRKPFLGKNTSLVAFQINT